MRIAIDIGNTRLHIGLIDTQSLLCLHRVNIVLGKIEEDFLAVIKEFTKDINIEIEIMLSSCRKAEEQFCIDNLIKLGFRNISPVVMHNDLPITFEYENREMLGRDRIANCLYAHAAFPFQDCIIVSAGTAVTIDIINQGTTFKGGVILAGLDTQLRALHEKTDLLPSLSIFSGIQFNLPGKSTNECMLSGTYFGLVGAIEKIVSEMLKIQPKSKLICTGGAWPLLMKRIAFEHAFLPDATLIGTAIFNGAHAQKI